MRSKMAQFILRNAEPEEALRVAHDTALDMSAHVKHMLETKHGRTFDRLFDGVALPEAHIRTKSLGDRIIAALEGRDHPLQVSSIAALVYDRHAGGNQTKIRDECRALVATGRLKELPNVVGRSGYRYAIP